MKETTSNTSPEAAAQRARYASALQPVGDVENALVDMIADCHVRKQIISIAEYELRTVLIAEQNGKDNPTGRAYQADFNGKKMLPQLFSQLARIDRQYLTALACLERKQSRREDTEPDAKSSSQPAPEGERPAPVRTPHPAEPIPFNPTRVSQPVKVAAPRFVPPPPPSPNSWRIVPAAPSNPPRAA